MTVIGNVLVLVTLCALQGTNAIEDYYCSVNTFEDDQGGMHFTKEPSHEEFAIVGNFKGLHCCAKGYKSIEWFKDNEPYPWGLHLSNFVIFPESANQTIYTHTVQDEDNGIYKCLLKNESVVHEHSFKLNVFNKNKVPDEPQTTYYSEDQEVYAGDSMRLFCEAFGGRTNLPDAYSGVAWRKVLSNGSSIEVPEESQRKISREEGQIFGTYLLFDEIGPDDFGTYTCVITKPGKTITKSVTLTEKVRVQEYVDPNPFPLKEVLIMSFLALVLLTTILILIKQYGLKVRVLLKDSYGSLEDNDGRSTDILIAYNPKDSELVVGVMVPNLEARGYSCVTKELPKDLPNWPTVLPNHAKSSRRLITILSPAALCDSWSTGNLYQALKQLQCINTPRLICVTLKELPTTQNEAKNSVGETLSTVARSMNVLIWERSSDSRFWLELCKELPAKRGLRDGEKTYQQSRPRLTSERSVDSLMGV